jgi:cytochrome c oxidase assembly protein subunit 15
VSQLAGYAVKTKSGSASAQNRRLVAGWLFVVAAMIWVMVGIGGYTRDSGSGLSIMDWDPIMGTLPPMTAAAWDKLFALYQSIPQARILHHGMDLAGFKSLFWPEYLHRLWGRIIGVAFFEPLVVFVVTKRIEARLIPWLALLFVLGGLQGAIGWFMVASGFDPNSVAVAPWRLTLHFTAAMLLFIAIFWTGLTVLRPQPVRIPGLRAIKVAAIVSIVSLAATMFAGTFVSGTQAVKAFNPAAGVGVGQPPAGWPFVSFYSDKAAILFNHQTLAFVTVVAVLTTLVLALRRRGTPPRVRDAALAMGGFVLLQFGLGVTALVSGALDLGVAHQMDAVLLLTASLYMLHCVRGGTR